MAMATRTRDRAAPAARPSAFGIWVRRRGFFSVVRVVGLTIFTIWTLFPFLWIVETAIKPNKDLYGDATLWPQHLTGVHFQEVVRKTKFFTYFRNSIIVSVSTTLIAMVIGVLAAYALTRLVFRGRTVVARAVIVTYLVPGSLLFIPVFQIARQLYLTDKASGLIVIYLIGTVPFCTWLAISYFTTIPSELLLIGRDSEKTIPAGLAGLINGDVYQWGALMASALIASLPPILIYIAAQRWVIGGLAGGAVKG